MKVFYRDNSSEKTAGLHELEVDSLNELQGADIPHLQVLRSAAGFYIGTLCKADWHPTFWEPNYRDSAYYWESREQAVQALIDGNYAIKF